MTDKKKIREEVERLQNELVQEKEKGFGSDTDDACILELQNVLTYIDSLQEEPVSIWHNMDEIPIKGEVIVVQTKDTFYGISVQKGGTTYKNRNKDRYVRWAYASDLLNLSNVQRTTKDWKEPVSEELEQTIDNYLATYWGGEKEKQDWPFLKKMAIHFANWQKENLWKPADGDDLPEYDREVIVLISYNAQCNIHDEEYPTYRVGFGHRPNPNGWDGKNIETNEVTHYTPKLYDKGGWNAPNIVYWLDARLPYEENKIDKEIEP